LHQFTNYNGLHNGLRKHLPQILNTRPLTTKQIGGIALTSSLFYISLNLHERNRLYQSHLLRQQSNLLRNITDPQPKEPPQTARHLVPGLADRLKYRWNTELEAAVRNIQHFNWEQWRREAENKVSSVFSKRLGSAVDEAEKKTS
jgi:altered-inheritance-of-mitochondria protein 5